MNLFRKKSVGCENCRGDVRKTAGENNESGARIKVLGSGCAKCEQLAANVKEALKLLGRDTAIDHVTDFARIAAYGVMTTPALVADGKVVSCGKVLSVKEAAELLKKGG